MTELHQAAAPALAEPLLIYARPPQPRRRIHYQRTPRTRACKSAGELPPPPAKLRATGSNACGTTPQASRAPPFASPSAAPPSKYPDPDLFSPGPMPPCPAANPPGTGDHAHALGLRNLRAGTPNGPIPKRDLVSMDWQAPHPICKLRPGSGKLRPRSSKLRPPFRQASHPRRELRDPFRRASPLAPRASPESRQLLPTRQVLPPKTGKSCLLFGNICRPMTKLRGLSRKPSSPTGKLPMGTPVAQTGRARRTRRLDCLPIQGANPP